MTSRNNPRCVPQEVALAITSGCIFTYRYSGIVSSNFHKLDIVRFAWNEKQVARSVCSTSCVADTDRWRDIFPEKTYIDVHCEHLEKARINYHRDVGPLPLAQVKCRTALIGPGTRLRRLP